MKLLQVKFTLDANQKRQEHPIKRNRKCKVTRKLLYIFSCKCYNEVEVWQTAHTFVCIIPAVDDSLKIRKHLDENSINGENRMSAYFLIDKTLTEQINRSIEAPMCECDDCQWYYQYIKYLPATAKEFFTKSGVELEKCQELWAYHPKITDMLVIQAFSTSP